MSVNQVPITGAKSGITGTAAQLVSTSTPIQYGAQIVAAAANSGKVYGTIGSNSWRNSRCYRRI